MRTQQDCNKIGLGIQKIVDFYLSSLAAKRGYECTYRLHTKKHELDVIIQPSFIRQSVPSIKRIKGYVYLYDHPNELVDEIRNVIIWADKEMRRIPTIFTR